MKEEYQDLQDDSISEIGSDNFKKFIPQSPKIHPNVKKEQIEKNLLSSIHKSAKAKEINLPRQARPRLIIDSIVLQNFKSYANRQQIGPFHPNFTSIMGPNGSGKSNLIQSLLFIFGFSASWMRLSKLQQLIHNSSKMENINKAAVEVHFKKVLEQSDGLIKDVPYSNFSIRRVVNSSSGSKYFIDRNESTQSQVKQKLKMQGIDLNNNRFLILQGEVEQISQMKQKSSDKQKPGLLQYLEEIIGSNQFIQKIEESVNKYNQAEEQKHQKGQMMRAVENDLKSLTKAKEEAINFVKKQKKIFQMQNILGQIHIFEAKQVFNNLSQQLTNLEQTRDKVIEEEKEKLKKQQDRIRQMRKIRDEMNEIQKLLDAQLDHCNRLQAEDKNIIHEIKFKSEDLVKLTRKLDQSDKQLSRIISNSEQIKQKIPRTALQIEQKSNKLEALKTQLIQYDKPHIKQKIKGKETDIQKINIEISILRSKQQIINESITTLKNQKNNFEQRQKNCQQKIYQHKNTIIKIQTALKLAQEYARERFKKIEQYRDYKNKIQLELQQIDDSIRQTINKAEQSNHSNNLFKQIMKLKLPGVLGRLGDLGEAREYDQIITTCCNKLDHLVVYDYDTANQVINFLKKNRMGRVTCIILDKIGDIKQKMNQHFEIPLDSVRLFDKINFKRDQARLAFYFALGDTIYCENSSLGMKYSMENEHFRRRVISKKGNGYIIYQINGLMIGSQGKRGGFLRKAGINSNHMAQNQERKNILIPQLEEVKNLISIQEKQYKSVREDIYKMENELKLNCENLKQFEDENKDINFFVGKSNERAGSIQKLEIEIIQIHEKLKLQQNLKQQAEKLLEEFEKEQKSHQSEMVTNLRINFKKQKLQYLAKQKQFQKQKAILEATAKRVNDNKQLKKQIEKSIQIIKKEIDKLKNEQLDLQRKASQIIIKIAGYEQSMKKYKQSDQNVRNLMEHDNKVVQDSKAKIQKSKKDVEVCQDMCRRQKDEVHKLNLDLEQVRITYKQMTSAYDFMDSIDEIEQMNINKDVKDQLFAFDFQVSHSNQNTSKSFPIQKLMQTDPCENLRDDKLEVFVVFRDKIISMISIQNAQLKKLQGHNLQVINQYKIKYKNYKERLLEFEHVKQRQLQLRKQIDQLKRARLQAFRQGFSFINSKLKEVYQHLTKGGDAQLEIIDTLDPFSDGVNFSVRPPKKSWKQVNKLSGGEKTLSSLSLIFALHYYKPTPLYFMDQIDAALDFKNVSIVADYIKKRTKDAQFIIISLRNNMFEQANKLIGVYKTNDQTKTIYLEIPQEILEEDKEKENNSVRANAIRVL